MRLINFAPRSQRLLGQVLDGIIGVAPLLASVMLSSVRSSTNSLLIMAALAWGIFYYFFADGLHDGQSIGKRWLGNHSSVICSSRFSVRSIGFSFSESATSVLATRRRERSSSRASAACARSSCLTAALHSLKLTDDFRKARFARRLFHSPAA
jgi:hypothetical protein